MKADDGTVSDDATVRFRKRLKDSLMWHVLLNEARSLLPRECASRQVSTPSGPTALSRERGKPPGALCHLTT